MVRRGLSHEQAWTSTTKGRGPWWDAGTIDQLHGPAGLPVQLLGKTARSAARFQGDPRFLNAAIFWARISAQLLLLQHFST